MGIALLSVGLGLLAWRNLFGVNDSDAQETLAQAKRLGLPVTWQEFLALQPKGGDDSSADYQKIAKVRPSVYIRGRLRPILAGTAEELKALLPNDTTLQLCERAARHRDFVPQRNWSGDPFAVMFPEYSAMRGTAEVLAVRAVYRAKTGNVAPAIDDLRLIRNTAKHAWSEHFIISGLVAIGCDRIYLMAAEQIASANEHNDNILAILEQDARNLVRPDFREALKSEFASGRREFELISMGKITPRRTVIGNTIVKLHADKSKAEFSERMVAVVDAWGDWPRVASVQANWEKPDNELIIDFGNEVLTTFTGVVLAVKRNEAILATAQIALAAQRSKNQTVAWPTLEKAAATASVSPIDPFTGKNYIYKTNPNQVIVYSAGPNGIDDGGSESGKSRDEAVFAITIRK